MPQKADGVMIEPEVSEPMANATSPAATDAPGPEDEPPLQLSERARLRELEREVRELRMKADFLSKAAAYFAAEHR